MPPNGRPAVSTKQANVAGHGTSEASPQTAEVRTTVIATPQRAIGPPGRIHSRTRGLSDRPPPSAAPRSGRHPDRLATPKVAGQTTCLLMWSGRLTLPVLPELVTTSHLPRPKKIYAASETALGTGGPYGAVPGRGR